jgi:hypothetical protein
VATLHVRNVPDQLYETLRATAELEGRSIGAQAVALLQQGLKANVAVRQRLRRLGSGPSFLIDARRAVVLAQEEVRALRHAEVGTEHVLLGLLQVGGNIAAALSKPPLVVDVDEVRRRVAELRPAAEEPPTGQIPFTPGAKKALEQALREALALKDRHIGPEHVLLGVAAVEDDPGARILADLGADLDTLRSALVLSFSSLVAAPPPPLVGPDADWSYRAVALTGSAEDWTASLNELAGAGWELVSILTEAGEPRAVFRRPANEAE